MTHVGYGRPVPEGPEGDAAAIERAVGAAALGAGPVLDPAAAEHLVDVVRHDPDGRVRAAALAALVRRAPGDEARRAWAAAAADSDAAVRRRAVETAPALGRAVAIDGLLALLGDDDAWVAEGAAFALGERPDAGARVVDELVAVATAHADALVRESAIAALGAIGDPAGLPAVLAGCADKPAIRRRAILALAAFDGPEVEGALRRALEDVDWQVRQAAEDLLHDNSA
jgi:HEAT repeat protein